MNRKLRNKLLLIPLGILIIALGNECFISPGRPGFYPLFVLGLFMNIAGLALIITAILRLFKGNIGKKGRTGLKKGRAQSAPSPDTEQPSAAAVPVKAPVKQIPDENRQKVFAAAKPRIPTDIGTPAQQLRLLDNLSRIVDVNIYTMYKSFLGGCDPQDNKKTGVVVSGIAKGINEYFGLLNIDRLIKDADAMDVNVLLDSYVLIDYYIALLGPENALHLRGFESAAESDLAKRLPETGPQTKPAAAAVTETKPAPADTQKTGVDTGEDPDTFIRFTGSRIDIDSDAYAKWSVSHKDFICRDSNILLGDRPYTISLYDNGKHVRDYILGTKDGEDFKNKYFLISVSFFLYGPSRDTPTVYIDGVISDTTQHKKLGPDDIAYRFEHYLPTAAEGKSLGYSKVKGRDLFEKGFRRPGITNPGNIRFVGICSECGRSFTFRGCNIYLTEDEPVYSDDGLDVCAISTYEVNDKSFDKGSWSWENDGKTYRYYNPFNCPNCGAPYIDYKSHPEMKKFGICACAFLDRNMGNIPMSDTAQKNILDANMNTRW